MDGELPSEGSRHPRGDARPARWPMTDPRTTTEARRTDAQQPLLKRVRIAYGQPQSVSAWTYREGPKHGRRSIHVEIITLQGEAIQVVVTAPGGASARHTS